MSAGLTDIPLLPHLGNTSLGLRTLYTGEVRTRGFFRSPRWRVLAERTLISSEGRHQKKRQRVRGPTALARSVCHIESLLHTCAASGAARRAAAPSPKALLGGAPYAPWARGPADMTGRKRALEEEDFSSTQPGAPNEDIQSLLHAYKDVIAEDWSQPVVLTPPPPSASTAPAPSPAPPVHVPKVPPPAALFPEQALPPPFRSIAHIASPSSGVCWAGTARRGAGLGHPLHHVG